MRRRVGESPHARFTRIRRSAIATAQRLLTGSSYCAPLPDSQLRQVARFPRLIGLRVVSRPAVVAEVIVRIRWVRCC